MVKDQARACFPLLDLFWEESSIQAPPPVDKFLIKEFIHSGRTLEAERTRYFLFLPLAVRTLGWSVESCSQD